MNRRRPLRALLLALACELGLALTPAPSPAQTPNPNESAFQSAPAEEGGGGDPTFGYFVFVLFAGGTIFLVCVSARRG